MTRIIANFLVAVVVLAGAQAQAFQEGIFWTVLADPSIYVSQLDGTGAHAFMTLDANAVPTGVAFDRIHGDLYWASTSPTGGTISKTKLDGSGVVESVVSSASIHPTAIALDLDGGHVYWTHFPSLTSPDGQIQRADLDGSGVVETIQTGLSNPKALCMDVGHNSLLWSESGAGKIMSYDLASSTPSLVRSGLTSPQGLAVDYIGHALFSAQGSKIARLSLSASEDFLTGLGDVFGLAIDQGDREIYWSSPLGGGIYRANLDNPVTESLVDASAGYITLAVPEPSCLVLAAVGLIGLLAYASHHRLKNR
jgi:hypothetical protein